MAQLRNRSEGELHSALLSLDKRRIKLVLKKNPEVNESLIVSFVNKMKNPKTPLLGNSSMLRFAIMENELEICKYLLEDGARLNVSKGFIQPLVFALSQKRYDIARLLIAYGAHLDQPDDDGSLPLQYALFDYDMVVHILEAGFPINGIIDKGNGITALHGGVMCNTVKVVKYLLKNGANVNAKCKNGILPLNFAVYANYPHLVKILIDHGVNVNYDSSPLLDAIKFNHADIVEMLLEAGADIHHAKFHGMSVSPIHFAVLKCQPVIVRLLLEKGANVNAFCSQSGNTPLLTAANNHIMMPEEKEKGLKVKKIVEHLLEFGAKVDVKGDIGNAFDVAMMVDNFDIIALLLKAGGKPTQFQDVLIPAVKRGDLNAIQICLEFGEDYLHFDMTSKSAYHYALSKHGLEVLKLFWKYGCPFNQEIECFTLQEFDIYTMVKITKKNKMHLKNQENFIVSILEKDVKGVLKALKNGAEPRGRSQLLGAPIIFASSNGLYEITRILLKNGVPANTFFNGVSPLVSAAREDHEQICILLLQYGACYKTRTHGKTPRQHAKSKTLKSLFKNISRMYKAVELGDANVLKKLESLLKNNFNLFWGTVNTKNRFGSTLMETALARGHNKIADGIMMLRLQAKTL